MKRTRFCWDNDCSDDGGKSSSLNTRQHVHINMCQLSMTICPILRKTFDSVVRFISHFKNEMEKSHLTVLSQIILFLTFIFVQYH